MKSLVNTKISFVDVHLGILMGLLILGIYGSHLQNEQAILEAEEKMAQHEFIEPSTPSVFIESLTLEEPYEAEAQLEEINEMNNYDFCIEVVKEDFQDHSSEVQAYAMELCDIWNELPSNS
jgi:hypothetical protein